MICKLLHVVLPKPAGLYLQSWGGMNSVGPAIRDLSGLDPTPISNCGFQHILAVFFYIEFVIQQPVADQLLGVGCAGSQAWYAIDDIARQMKPVEIIHYHHVERSCGRPFLLVPPDMQVFMISSPICETMNQPWISVIGKDDGLVFCEKYIEILITQSMRVLALRLQGHQIDNIDNAYFKARELLSKQLDSGKGLERRDIARAGRRYISC